MTDVSCGLILPDLETPCPGLLKTLALYWDELVDLRYEERFLQKRGPTEEEDEIGATLQEAGILRQVRRTLKPVVPSNLRAETERLLDILAPFMREGAREEIERDRRANDADERLVLAAGPIGAIDNALVRRQDDNDPYWKASLDATRHLLESVAKEGMDHYLLRLSDAKSLAAANNLAPIAGSVVARLGSEVGQFSEELPLREAALVSVVAGAFSVAPNTPIEKVLNVRDRHRASRARLRASLADLAGAISRDVSASQRLAQAHDVFRNRVEPALGDLETVLSENRISFFVKSLLGVTALATPPPDPIRTVAGGVRLTADVLEYRFSKDRLMETHPYGYLHHVGQESDLNDLSHATRFLVEPNRDPRQALAKAIMERVPYESIARRIWGFDFKD